MIRQWFHASLKNSASRRSLSGCLHISRTGFSSVEMCTGPVVPLGGSLRTGFGTWIFSLRLTGIRIGTGDCLVIIA